MRVLAIGAAGQFAGLVVPALVSRGVQVRALLHDPAKQERVRDAGADQAVVGDLRDPATVRAALDGVDGVFLIIPAFAPDTAALGMGVVAAARAAGVRRLVFSGVYHPSLSLVNHASMRPVEESVYRRGCGPDEDLVIAGRVATRFARVAGGDHAFIQPPSRLPRGRALNSNGRNAPF